jgi:hypothetical protein
MKETMYCAIDNVGTSTCGYTCMEECCRLRHKWPSPTQFRNEHNCEIPNEMPAWRLINGNRWHLTTFEYAKRQLHKEIILIACSPYGAPPQNYRPDETEVIKSQSVS